MPEYDERLNYLFQRYMDNTCTREELEELSRRVGADSGGHIEELMDIHYARVKPGENADRVEWELMFRNIIGRQSELVPVRQFRSRRWIAAAVLILLAGIGSYYYLLGPKKSRESRPGAAITTREQDIAPGEFKAMLTLGDGHKIVLDSIAAGKLAQQGAASIVNKSGGLVYADDHSSHDRMFYNTLSTARGQTYSFTLADGTKVWLDAASTLRFPTTFRGAERSVEIIDGQAYFEVAANARMPFFVRQGKNTIQVLGTHFNVNAYGEEGMSKVTLLEGSVKVNTGDGGQSMILKPGQQARITGSKASLITDIDQDQVVAWKNGLFNFRDTELKTVMQEIARWYAIDIGYEGAAPRIALTGKAPRSISLATMLKLLQLSNVKYRIEGKKLIISQ
jgi:ferric-dicitrate binding protein FerR (iron transport regulator)